MTKDLDRENSNYAVQDSDLPMELTPADTETSNQRESTGIIGKVLFFYSAFVAVWHIYSLVFNPVDPMIYRNLHLLTLGIMGFAYFPGWSKAKDKIHVLDYAGMAALIFVTTYIIRNLHDVLYNFGKLRASNVEMAVAVIGIVIVLELARRTSGNSLPILAIIFMLYPFIGKYLPGVFATRAFTAREIFTYLYTTRGVFSDPINISAVYIIMFIIFSSFLTISGVGTYFVEFAFAVSGFARGGPAKVAVISSALMGMMNGTSAGNVVATGSLSIPLMKRVGYSPTFAAATEAVASTGGQIMPPIMGAGVFLMAEITNIRYERIMLAGIIPAILYFFSCYMMVDYEAIKLKLYGVPRHLLPSIPKTLKRAYLFIPVAVLIYALLAKYSVIYAGFYGIISSFLVSLIAKETRMGPMKILEALEKGARGSVQLMSVCAAAGIVMGVIALTGVGGRFANVLMQIADTNIMLALFFTMGVVMLLGMGMPTTAAYAVAASVMGPGLISITRSSPQFAHLLNIDPNYPNIIVLIPHMFIFFFACISAITPPVALAAYAGAGISGSDPMRTGVMSFRLGIASYIIPYMFFFAPQILLITGPEVVSMPLIGAISMSGSAMVLLRTATALVGVLGLASAVQGYFGGHLNAVKRLIMLVASFCLVSPSELQDIVGIAVMALVYFSSRIAKEEPVEKAPKAA